MTDGYTIFMLIKATRAWLDLPPRERFAFLASDVEPILSKHPAVTMGFFDTEFYNSEVSDVIVWETSDLRAYESTVEDLRDTLFWDHYFTVVSILPGVENAYRARAPVKGA